MTQPPTPPGDEDHEIGRAIVRQWNDAVGSWHALSVLIAQAIAAARAEERDRCAKAVGGVQFAPLAGEESTAIGAAYETGFDQALIAAASAIAATRPEPEGT